MKRVTSVLKKFHLVKDQPESEMRQRLKAELFAYNSCMQHGFPNKPTAMAFDDQLHLLIIGTKSGNIRIYGRPGVEFSAHHSSYISVSQIHFIPGKGRFVTLCNDNSIHLWRLKLHDGVSTLEEVASTTFDSSKIKRVMACCLTDDCKHFLLGTDAGHIFTLDIDSLRLTERVIYRDGLVIHAPDDLRSNSGCINSIQRHPTKSSKFLVGFSRGLIVLLDLVTVTVDLTYHASLNLESLSFSRDGNEFASAHIDGSYIIWNSAEVSRPKEPANTPYGPFPCKAIKKILWQSSKKEPFVLFSGGMPRASHGERNTVTVMRGSEHIVFDLTSKVVDFNVIWTNSENEPESKTLSTLLILAEEEFVAIDLLSPGWPLHRLPYLDSIHASTVLSASHVTDVPSELLEKLVSFGNQQFSSYSSLEWPVNGGKNLVTDVSSHALLLTGHDNGTVRFWDVSSTCMRLVYKLSLLQMYNDEMSLSFDPTRMIDIDDEWPPFRRVGVYDPFSDDMQLGIQKMLLTCSDSTLFVCGSTGQVVVMNLDAIEQRQTIKVVPVHVMDDNNRDIWRSRNPSKVRDGEVKFSAGYQPTCIFQIYPPAPCTALVANTSRSLLAFGTAHGFALVDYRKQDVLYTKSTLEPIVVEEIATVANAAQRRRSIKKSLRDSFRRLRNGKVTMRRRSRSHAGDSVRSADNDRPNSQPVSLVASAAGSRSYESEAENEPHLIEFRQLSGAATVPASTSSCASLSALTPPSTPRRTITNKKLDLRSADIITSSVVRSLHFADTSIVDGEKYVPTLWVGTNGGIVYVHQLANVITDKDQGIVQCRCFLVKQIQLRHHSPILAISVIDRSSQTLDTSSATMPEVNRTGDSSVASSGGHQAVICTEQQIKVFALPSLKTLAKCRLSTQNGVKLRQAHFVEFHSRSDSQYYENCVVGLTSTAEVFVIGLTNLSHELKADKLEIDGSVNASLFTKYGELFCLHSSSEYARLSLSADRIVRPRSLIETMTGTGTAGSPVLQHSTASEPAESCQSEQPMALAARCVTPPVSNGVPAGDAAISASNLVEARMIPTATAAVVTSNGLGPVDVSSTDEPVPHSSAMDVSHG